MHFPHWLSLFALYTMTPLTVIGWLVGVYRSAGGKGIEDAAYDTAKARMQGFVTDAILGVLMFVVYSLAWSAR